MVPYLRAANVTWGGIDTEDVKEMDFSPKEQEVYRLRRGDVLLAEASGSASEVGKPALWREEVPGACFQNTLIRVRSKGPLPEFLYYQFLNEARAGRFANAGKGIGINHLGAERMSSWPVVVPPIDVQRRIVAKLDALLAQSQAAREHLEAVPSLVETYRQSLLAAAFRGDLTADWRKKNPDVEPASKLLERIRIERRTAWEAAELAKMKAKGKTPKDDKWKSKYVEPEPVDPTGLPALPPTWCWAKLEEIGVLDRGRSRHRPRNDERLFGGPYPFIQTGEVAHAGGTISTHRVTLSEFGLSQSRLWPAGTVCITIAANIADSAILAFPACFPDSVVGFLPHDGAAVSRYIEFFIRTARRGLERFAPATAQKNINLEILREIAVPLAPYQEQRHLVATAERRHDAIATTGVSAEALASLERSLLAQAFQGKLR
jgi:type I restriction enzyme S subunit